jgi:hypothetical protein
MDPQMMAALGMGGAGGMNPLAMLRAKMMSGGTGATPGVPTGIMPTAPQTPQAPMQPQASGAPPISPTAPATSLGSGPVTSGLAPSTGAPRSNPGLMPSSVPQTPPQTGTYESGPRMAGDSQNTSTNREPTGENPQRPQPQNALPHFPRNRFGAMLLPKGGEVGQQMAPPAGSTGAFDYNKLLGAFLQPRGTTL